MNEIIVQDSGQTKEDGDANLKLDQGPSMNETFCDPNIRRSAWVGCSISVIQ